MTVRIIKAHTTSGTPVGEAFNFVDLQRQSDDVIASAHCQADAILAKAQTEAASLREQAVNDGRSLGLHDAEQAIALQANEVSEQRVTAQLKTALPALLAAAESLRAERDRWLIRWEQIAVRLGVAIAEKLLHR